MPAGMIPSRTFTRDSSTPPRRKKTMLSLIHIQTCIRDRCGGFLADAARAAYRVIRPARSEGVAGTQRPGLRQPVTAALAAVVCALVGFAVPLPVEGPTARIMAVQGNVPRPGLDFNAERRAVLDNHVEVTVTGVTREREAGHPDPEFVVWPENCLLYTSRCV